MNHSETLDALATALCAAQGEFEAVAKDSTNPFFKSKYAGLPAVVRAATPILTEHGLAVSQYLDHDDQGDTLTTMLLHSSGQFISSTMRLHLVKDDPQGQGSATTYARRYSYMAALGLVADEDDDGNAGSASRKPPAKKTVAKPGGAVKPTASVSPSNDKADRAEPSPVVESEAVEKIVGVFKRSGKSEDWLTWALLQVKADTGPIEAAEGGTAKDRGDAFRKVLGSLRLEQAVLLVESMGGTAQDLL